MTRPRVRTLVTGVAVGLVILLAASAMVKMVSAQSLKNCLEASANATCDAELFKRFAELAKEPNEAGAREALARVSALYLAGSRDLPKNALRNAEVRLQTAVAANAIANPKCLIQASRDFAIEKLGQDAQRAALEGYSAVADLETPISSLIRKSLQPVDYIDFVFSVSNVDVLNNWLDSTVLTCSPEISQ